MEDAFRLYLIQNDLSKVTIRHYCDSVKAFYLKYSTLTETTATKHLLELLERTTPSNYNRHLKALRYLAKFQGISWFSSLKRMKEHPKVRKLLSDDQIKLLIAGDDKYSVAFAIHAYTGCRTSDILNLKVESIDLNLGCIYFNHGKGGKSRTAPILPPLKDKIEPFLPSCKEYLLELNGKPVSDTMYVKAWRKKLTAAGIVSSATPHSLRHSFLTNSLGNGANLYAVQDIVGHVSAETTRRYYHGNLELMKKAAAKLPLAQKQSDPQVLIDQIDDIIEEFLWQDKRFDKAKLREAMAKLQESIK